MKNIMYIIWASKHTIKVILMIEFMTFHGRTITLLHSNYCLNWWTTCTNGWNKMKRMLLSFIVILGRVELAQLVHACSYILEHMIIFQTVLNFLVLEGSLIIKAFHNHVRSDSYTISKLFTKIKLSFHLRLKF